MSGGYSENDGFVSIHGCSLWTCKMELTMNLTLFLTNKLRSVKEKTRKQQCKQCIDTMGNILTYVQVSTFDITLKKFAWFHGTQLS